MKLAFHGIAGYAESHVPKLMCFSVCSYRKHHVSNFHGKFTVDFGVLTVKSHGMCFMVNLTWYRRSNSHCKFSINVLFTVGN